MPKAKDKAAKGKKEKKTKKAKPAAAPKAAPAAAPTTASFDAGRLFERYADRGMGAEPSSLTRDGFARLVAELDIKAPPPKAAEEEPTPRTDFEAGRLFERFDSTKSSGLDRTQFAALLQELEQPGSGSSAPHRHAGFRPQHGFAAQQTPWRGAAAPWTAQYPTAPQPRTAWGASGRDDAPEFSAGQVFERYDSNKSGSLELEELRKLVADVRSGRLPLGQGPPPTASGGFPQRNPSVGPFAAGYGARPPSGGGMGMFGSGDLIYGGPAPRARHSSHPASATALQDAAAAGSLAEAYHSRLSSLSAVHARLMAKREAAVHQLARLGARREDVAAARRAVERETLADSEAVLHRLRSAEGLKQSLLAHDAARLAGDVEALDAFTARLLEVVPEASPAELDAGGSMTTAGDALSSVDPTRALSFMRSYPELCADADRLLARPVKTDIEVAADDFEREVATRAAVVKRHRALLDLLSAKDAIIHLLLRERESAASSRGQAAASSAEELRKWVGLAERLATELNTARADTEGVEAAGEAARVIDLQARALAAATATAVSGRGSVAGVRRRGVEGGMASRPSSSAGSSVPGDWRRERDASGLEGMRGGGWAPTGKAATAGGVAAVSDDDEDGHDVADDQGLAATGNPAAEPAAVAMAGSPGDE